MESKSLQDLVKRIFGDEQARDQFISDPRSIMSQYSLTEEEEKAVLDTHSRMGLVSGNSSELVAAIKPLTGWL